MKIQGWCENCHKIRLVRVTSRGLVNVAMGSAAVGICDQCEQEEQEARAKRFRERWTR